MPRQHKNLMHLSPSGKRVVSGLQKVGREKRELKLIKEIAGRWSTEAYEQEHIVQNARAEHKELQWKRLAERIAYLEKREPNSKTLPLLRTRLRNTAIQQIEAEERARRAKQTH